MIGKNLTPEKRGMLKGMLGTSLVFTVCAGIGLYFLHQRHEDELDELEKDTAKFCLDWAAEHYERALRRKRKATEEASKDSGEAGKDYSATTGYEATPKEWEELEEKIIQSCAEYDRLAQELVEMDAEYRAGLDKLRAQIYADNDRLNEAHSVDSCARENL